MGTASRPLAFAGWTKGKVMHDETQMQQNMELMAATWGQAKGTTLEGLTASPIGAAGGNRGCSLRRRCLSGPRPSRCSPGGDTNVFSPLQVDKLLMLLLLGSGLSPRELAGSRR